MTPAGAAWDHWHIHPSVAIGLAVFGGLYLFLGGARATVRRQTAFYAALLVLFFTLNGPLHDLSDTYLFSAHMVQHLVLTLVVPPLLIVGTPGWMLRPLLRPRLVRVVAERVTRPASCFVLFNVVL